MVVFEWETLYELADLIPFGEEHAALEKDLVEILPLICALLEYDYELQQHAIKGMAFRNLSVEISKGTDIEEILWYLPTQRKVDSQKN